MNCVRTYQLRVEEMHGGGRRKDEAVAHRATASLVLGV
jgi:hypothetical protein